LPSSARSWKYGGRIGCRISCPMPVRTLSFDSVG
jgi:hypothetical protein